MTNVKKKQIKKRFCRMRVPKARSAQANALCTGGYAGWKRTMVVSMSALLASSCTCARVCSYVELCAGRLLPPADWTTVEGDVGEHNVPEAVGRGFPLVSEGTRGL